jgi:D-alanyl-D-alanine carboxypeptidase/D-alanyl-D-alanine-endopeptidase (penicillin-binding protein 4)
LWGIALAGLLGIGMAGLLGIALAGCGGGERHAHRHARAARPSKRTVLSAAALPPARVALDSALSSQLRAAGPRSGAVVYDLTARRQLFAQRARTGRPPASVEKLYTAVAMLSELGPSARLHTTVLGTGHLAASGVWEGDLYLRGGGDPTFGDGTFNQIWEDGYGPTALQLSGQLRRVGIRRVTGRVIGDASLFDSRPGAPNTRYAPDIPDIGGELAALTYDHGGSTRRLTPGAFAARELVLTMRGDGIHARAARFTATTPAGARVLASVSSPPMAVLLKLMDVPSDDFFAEMLTKQLGVRAGAAGTTVTGAAVIRGVLAGLGIEPAIVDGSGLSRQDRSSPQQVVDLLRAVWGTELGRVLEASLPIVGVNGSARGLAAHSAARGRCLAKTGTLDYVSNLAGYCHSRGGHTLAFALFVDGPSNSRAFALIGRMVAAIARY